MAQTRYQEAPLGRRLGRAPRQIIQQIDNSRGYEPGNVKWTTYKEQLRNTRRNVRATLDGRTQCLSAWCEELGLNYNTVRARVYHGWLPEKALMVREDGRRIPKHKRR